MKSILLIAIASLGFSSVSAEQSKDAANSVIPIDEEGKKGVSSFQGHWYSSHLRLMKEEPMKPLAKDKETHVYRFTLLPTWGDPRCVRVDKFGDEFVIRFSRLDGDGGYDPGKLAETASASLTKKQADTFLKLFEDLGFFEQAAVDTNRGLDGSEWVLEAVIGGRYHVVERWTPKAYNPKKRGTVGFVKVCEWLLNNAPRKEGEQAEGGQAATRPGVK